jgi:hypothetical protein
MKLTSHALVDLLDADLLARQDAAQIDLAALAADAAATGHDHAPIVKRTVGS